MNNEFVRVRSNKDIAVTSALIITGSLLTALFESEAICILGFFTVAAGIFLLFILKTGYKDISTGTRYKKTEHYFPQGVKEEIMRQLKTDPSTLSYSEEDKGTGLRLDIYKDNKGISYFQLFEYIPYKYVPCSQIFKSEYLTK